MDKHTEKNKSKRAKGGAEKERDRKKKRLLDEGEKCKKIDQLFLNTTKRKLDDNSPIITDKIIETSTKDSCDQLDLLDQHPQGRLAHIYK